MIYIFRLNSLTTPKIITPSLPGLYVLGGYSGLKGFRVIEESSFIIETLKKQEHLNELNQSVIHHQGVSIRNLLIANVALIIGLAVSLLM